MQKTLLHMTLTSLISLAFAIITAYICDVLTIQWEKQGFCISKIPIVIKTVFYILTILSPFFLNSCTDRHRMRFNAYIKPYRGLLVHRKELLGHSLSPMFSPHFLSFFVHVRHHREVLNFSEVVRLLFSPTLIKPRQ